MSHKIAIIEDDPAILQMYLLKFEAEGYMTKTAVNGLLGLELLKDFAADLILLDIMMPQMGGVEMLTKLRATTKHKHTPVIVFTNVGEQEVPKGLAKLEVTDIIAKAYHTPAQVAEKVKQILAQ
jgi:two-component system, OmpR family, alkaline phosphatase synthesis response regulator PhoP